MNAPLFFLCADIANIVACALLGARMLVIRPGLLSARLIALIAFDTVCYIVLSRYDYSAWIAQPYRFEVGGFAPFLNFAQNLTPGLFMVLCFTLFADKPRFPRWLLALFFVQMFLEVPMRWFVKDGVIGDIATRMVPAFLQATFVGLALYWTIANWWADLIQSRRRARIFTIVIIGLNIIGSSLFLRVVIAQNSLANYYAHLALGVSTLPIILFILVFLNDEELGSPLGAAAEPTASGGRAPAVTSEIAAVLARLTALMEAEHVYRRPSLSVKDLADQVQIPEYRLRKIIHEQLGYANFNVYLHNYRVREACRQLRDPAMRRIPILTIALSTGYQSINTFNRGFREVMGMTPSAYRAMGDVQP